jgi:hypothetical protein
MRDSAAHRKLLGMQSPPPEEVVAKPLYEPGATPVKHMARRLMLANMRQAALRAIRVDRVAAFTQPAHLDYDTKPVWEELARLLLREQITNPERYIRAQHYYSLSTQGLSVAPFCNGFLSAEAVKRFRRYDEQADRYLQQQLVSDSDTFRCELGMLSRQSSTLSQQDAWDLVLRNETHEMSPLFRFATAASIPLPETAKLFRDAAYDQFMSDPIGYAANWQHVVPIAFEDAACEVLRIKSLRGGE